MIAQKLLNIKLGFNHLIILNFFILSFFTFFGTGLPFQKPTLATYEAETTNIVNQLVFSFLFISALIIIFKNYYSLSAFLTKEKFLVFFIIFCLISALWSGHSFLSIKRSFQLFVTYVTVLNIVLLLDGTKSIKVLKYIVILYLVVNYFSGLFIPGAIDPSFGTWRGIEMQKNGLGYAGFIMFLISLYFYDNDDSFISKFLNVLISILSIGLVILSGSSTVAVNFIIVLMLLIIFRFDRIFAPLRIGKFISNVIIFFIVLSGIILLIYSSQLLAMVPELFGKDLTLSGRTLIWPYLWDEVLKNLVHGYGYGTYWIMGGKKLEMYTYMFGNVINMAHNGYLEIMLQLGMLGISFFFVLLIIFLYRILKIDDKVSLVIVISILIMNITASTIFQLRSPTTLIFMYSYLLVTKNYFSSD